MVEFSPNQEIATRVAATMWHSEIDPRLCFVEDEAALALHGIETSGALRLKLMVEPSYLAQLANNRQTPSGMSLSEAATKPGYRRLVGVGDPGLLTIDAIGSLRLGKHLRFASRLHNMTEKLSFFDEQLELNVVSPAYLLVQKVDSPLPEDQAVVRQLSGLLDRRVAERELAA